MKNRYLLISGAAVAVGLGCAEANAQSTYTVWGWTYPYAFYIWPEGGWTGLPNPKDTVTTPPVRVDNRGINNNTGPFFTNFGGNSAAHYNNGYNVGARAGVQWGPLRVEEEYSYRRNGLTSDSLGLPVSASDGQRLTHSLMTNFIYDFTTLFGWPITPHLGFGIGAVNVNDSASLTPGTIPGPISFTLPTGPVFIQ